MSQKLLDAIEQKLVNAHKGLGILEAVEKYVEYGKDIADLGRAHVEVIQMLKVVVLALESIKRVPAVVSEGWNTTRDREEAENAYRGLTAEQALADIEKLAGVK